MPLRVCSLTLDEIAFRADTFVVRATDLQDMGVPRRTIHQRCRPGGPWRALLPGVLLLRNGPPTRDDHRRAALLYAGDTALLTGLDALELAGLRRIPTVAGPVHLLIPSDRRRLGAGRVLAERTERLPDARGSRLLPVAPVARAALDFCRRCRERDTVRAILAEVVQSGRATPAELRSELDAGSGRGSALPRTVLREIADGVRSVAEAKARELLGRCRLPDPLWNPQLVDERGTHVATPDAWFDEVGLAWEIDSREFHFDAADYERTVERHTRMTAAGIIVVHSLPQTLRRRGAEVVEELRQAYAHAARRPRPPVIALPAR
ncbi:hypothetical protein GCM10009836_21780 [Pseudonocardia ailaonensis]|uniref:Transcriptional regulator, AbiEi antitoxin, Type IV TA system n=1 Tax=Pseudonocardia ailaonensis TaxID=367279 RepID=A0ABN2MXK2_9PSEU